MKLADHTLGATLILMHGASLHNIYLPLLGREITTGWARKRGSGQGENYTRNIECHIQRASF